MPHNSGSPVAVGARGPHHVPGAVLLARELMRIQGLVLVACGGFLALLAYMVHAAFAVPRRSQDGVSGSEGLSTALVGMWSVAALLAAGVGVALLVLVRRFRTPRPATRVTGVVLELVLGGTALPVAAFAGLVVGDVYVYLGAGALVLAATGGGAVAALRLPAAREHFHTAAEA